ncbi:hypothetical protein F2P56_005332 [Juglans regia]|uniref:(-)-germacrene D synthase-like n=3 Tax=Juglans regia TaxID=51240 RepID=A0A833XVH0_JUGRE|nr:(-)-germacrene D synthase-like isoform X1 [Juglans regia]KAF5478802.1 hypothetical protein F2P56_005332 [Juglans regia]
MSIPVSGAGLSQNSKPNVVRRTANFPPSVWGDRFINYTSDDEKTQARRVREVEEMIKEVRRELLASACQPSQQLNLIDALQRLGVAYHLDREIQLEALEHMHAGYHDNKADSSGDEDHDLYNVALRFRLLRQQGLRVSCDVFNKFKDEKDNFKESLSTNIPGILALYEATHLRVHGEDILDEALAFTTAQLKSAASHLSNPIAAKVNHALKQPLHKGIPRLEARHFISIYQDDTSHKKAFLKLAILDFNLVQSLHKQELTEITRWWKDLDFATKLPFARDRVVECFLWIVAVYFEPRHSPERKMLTKIIAMASTIDDIYDAYGTLEELEIFTETIERWEIGTIDQLPQYMQICYRALLDIFKEIEQELAKQGRPHLVIYAKKAMKILVRAYFNEAKSFNMKKIPTMEEYMEIAIPSSGYPMLIAVSFVFMGEIVTKEAFEWIFSNPKVITASAVIARLMDDSGSHKFEQERGHAASAVECYMNQYGISETQLAYKELNRQVSNAWKDINEEFTRPNAMPMPLLMCVLNFSRAIDVIYKNGDGYTRVGKEMSDNVAAVLIHPVPIIV